MRKKPKTHFDRCYFQNRWKQEKYARDCDWTIIGISKRWSSPTDYCYKICFFGLQLSLWYKRIFNN